jgi:hypothetical protein
MKNLKDLGNQTCGLPTYSGLPESAALSRTPTKLHRPYHYAGGLAAGLSPGGQDSISGQLMWA